ncbi:MAG: phosphate starvation-inducible protein PhoH [Spirochaetae bacterium HGW-Spirochaetae-3]|jgi:PhoH-like ATPase|nr:MAG: phosphate starvation-inducible protein PhoH [Spirochaetae bacterium HGW-Spirochaetae-3]
MADPYERKVFVVDTNVLIHNPESVLSFRDNEIVIPLQVLEELDNLKTYSDQRGKSARDAIRFLDSISKRGDLHEGVKLENGSTLRVSLAQSETAPKGFDTAKNDNRIILCAAAIKESGRQVFFVSKDINARVKATAIGVKAVDYEKEKVDIATLYQGVQEIDVAPDLFATFEATGSLPWKDRLRPNEFIVLKERGGERELIGRCIPEEGVIEALRSEPGSVSGVSPLNARQRVALELLLDDSLSLVTIMGKAGTGKTLLAIAAGLRKVFDDKTYAKMLVTRPVVPVGKDIGYLPGEKSAKMANWMQPIFDNLEYILGVHKREKIKSVDQMIKDKQIEIEALTYIRGRSLPNEYIVIDEAQNLTPHEIKTIVSRAGQGSKVVLTGDPYQIDNMYLDANSNGLSYLVDAFKGQSVYGHVTLQKSERSELAELASSLL